MVTLDRLHVISREPSTFGNLGNLRPVVLPCPFGFLNELCYLSVSPLCSFLR
jgi:hypothetical protein